MANFLIPFEVSIHSRLKAADDFRATLATNLSVSIHSRLKAAGPKKSIIGDFMIVSIHSRLKAAAHSPNVATSNHRFNTQPPEGGCRQADHYFEEIVVSIHSRLKAAETVPLPPPQQPQFQYTAA